MLTLRKPQFPLWEVPIRDHWETCKTLQYISEERSVRGYLQSNVSCVGIPNHIQVRRNRTSLAPAHLIGPRSVMKTRQEG